MRRGLPSDFFWRAPEIPSRVPPRPAGSKTALPNTATSMRLRSPSARPAEQALDDPRGFYYTDNHGVRRDGDFLFFDPLHGLLLGGSTGGF